MSDWTAKASDGITYDLEHLSTQKWLDGHVSGLDAAVGWLNNEAVRKFQARDTKDALALQVLADRMLNEMRPVLLKAADAHHKDYPSEISSKQK